jgi:hypothetical protein
LDIVEWDFQSCEDDLGGESIPTPEELDLMGIPQIGPDTGLTTEEPWPAGMGTGSCVTTYGDLYEAYALTGSDEILDLLGRFVRATVSAVEPETKDQYLEALAGVPGRMEKQIHDWYWIRNH